MINASDHATSVEQLETSSEQTNVTRADPAASLGSRALAAIIDAYMLPGMMVFAIAGLLLVERWPLAGTLLSASGFAGWVGYLALAWTWVNRDGQSPGKKLLGICLRDLEGRRVSLARVFWLRNALPALLGRIPVAGPLFLLVDHGVALTKARRCLHDYFAGTQVVRAPSPPLTSSARAIIVLLTLPCAVAYLGAAVMIEAFQVEGPSTEPGLLSGDRVITLTNYVLAGVQLTRGDVVIANSPDGSMIIKRVVGLPGDVIEMGGADLYINSELVSTREVGPCKLGVGGRQPSCRVYESSLGGRTFQISYARTGAVDPEPLEVPEGAYYLLGDHRDSSNDSRNPAVGAFPAEAIHALVLSIYWSSNDEGIRWSRFGTSVK